MSCLIGTAGTMTKIPQPCKVHGGIISAAKQSLRRIQTTMHHLKFRLLTPPLPSPPPLGLSHRPQCLYHCVCRKQMHSHADSTCGFLSSTPHISHCGRPNAWIRSPTTNLLQSSQSNCWHPTTPPASPMQSTFGGSTVPQQTRRQNTGDCTCLDDCHPPPPPHPTPGARTCAARMPRTRLVLLLRQVHPENPGFYPISKGPLRRANTLTTKIVYPLFPQTLHNHKHIKIGTHFIISLGPLWPFVVSRKYIHRGAGVRGQIQTTTQHLSHGRCQIAAPHAPGIRCAPSGDGLVSVVYKGRYGSQCQGITHGKHHLIKTRDTTAVRGATSDGTNLPSLPATVSPQPRRNMAKVTAVA